MSDHVRAEAEWVMKTYGHLLPGYREERSLSDVLPGAWRVWVEPVVADTPKPKRDLSGQRFGMLVALYPIPPEKRRGWRWRCRCDCGKESSPYAFSLTRRNTRSCGCQRRHQPGRKIKPETT